MARLSVLQRFESSKTKSKLLATFGVISVIIITMSAIGVSTLRQLATSSQTVYVDYTVPLAEFAEMGTALTSHHQILTGIAGVTRQASAFLFRSAWENVERVLLRNEPPLSRAY